MSIWGDPPTAEPVPYGVGDRVTNGAGSFGVVMAVERSGEYWNVAVAWDDAQGRTIVYPAEASFLRKAFPWET